MDTPVYRFLRGYSLDPGFSTRLDTAGINEVIYRVPFEPLEPGPCGAYVDVVDVDPASGCWYAPVDLSDERIASQHGLAPSEGHPQFHQQFVYAVAMKTVGHFERALGRKVVWARRPPMDERAGRPRRARTPEYELRLRLYPHALRDANAYYDPDKTAVLFGYFDAADQVQGANYPGGLVFTCLSPDIVAHEVTHALLDSVHRRYLEDTNPDVAAFHEGFADIVALLQRFTFRQLVEDRLCAAGGQIDQQAFILGELATQFGEALEGHRGALRSMIGEVGPQGTWRPRTPSPADYAASHEAHDRGAVLVATIFDAFQRIYRHRTQDLLRIATNGTGILPAGRPSRDLVGRLAAEAAEIAEHLLHICIRALDYSPPTDITFGSYLRALITADLDIAPEDERGYRVALIEAFRARGIFPSRVTTLSEDSLVWQRPQFTRKQDEAMQWVAARMQTHIRGLVETRDRRRLAQRAGDACAALHVLLQTRKSGFGAVEWERFLNALGLTSRPVSTLFGAASRGVRFLNRGRPSSSHVPPLEVHSIRPAFRAGREGRQVEQVVVTLTQTAWVDAGGAGERLPMAFRGGASLVLTLGETSTVDYAVIKNIRSHDRFLDQVAYVTGRAPGGIAAASPYVDDRRGRRLDFTRMHRAGSHT